MLLLLGFILVNIPLPMQEAIGLFKHCSYHPLTYSMYTVNGSLHVSMPSRINGVWDECAIILCDQLAIVLKGSH